MAKPISRWIEVARRRETVKEENAVVVESVKTIEEVGVRLSFEWKSIRLGDEVIDEEREWKPTWRKVKTCLQKAMESSEAKPTRQRNSKSNPRTSRRMSSLVEPKVTRKEDILNHDDTTTNCGDKIVESSDRIGSRWKL